MTTPEILNHVKGRNPVGFLGKKKLENIRLELVEAYKYADEIEKYERMATDHMNRAMPYSGGWVEMYHWNVHRANICKRLAARYRVKLQLLLMEIVIE